MFTDKHTQLESEPPNGSKMMMISTNPYEISIKLFIFIQKFRDSNLMYNASKDVWDKIVQAVVASSDNALLTQFKPRSSLSHDVCSHQFRPRSSS
ncbi:hypothetical protein Tco_0926256 [Tanacetum coccineum]|uniref:Uncharacterized protein n=1 Tax=Tanacetum coccineum TaxID=301880 RepID=A0ABQ5DBT6_9ASTR